MRIGDTLRYLDSDAEEQRRGITMKASGIALRYRRLPKKNGGNDGTNGVDAAIAANNNNNETVIHLHDSPGHVDFSVEVASSLLLSDTALILVDAVEGICARTHSLLREAYGHEMTPVLVINKLDRLTTDLGLSPEEAYVRVRECVESVNAVCAGMIQSASSENHDVGSEIEGDRDGGDDDEDDKQRHWNFDPVKGNVVFASALHGWGFTVPTLARSLFKSKTIPIKPPTLRQYLFGDYRYKHENGKVLKWKQGGGGKPMFEEFASRPIWKVYEKYLLL